MKHYKKFITSILLFFFTSNNVMGQMSQEFSIRPFINKDSLAYVVANKLTESEKSDFLDNYNNSTPTNKELLLLKYLRNKSSKQEMIHNFENKKEQIYTVIEVYKKIVPENYLVEIAFISEDSIIDLDNKCYINIKKRNKRGVFDLVYNGYTNTITLVLREKLELLGWNEETLTILKQLLFEANCISIRNGKMTTVGFLLTDQEEYSYKIFDSKLTEREIQRYNQCPFIYYKDNIVLEYMGIGPTITCFPE